MAITIKQGTPKDLINEVKPIVNDCFEGIWTPEDLNQLIEIPHESQTFFVAFENNKPIGYAYIVADFYEAVDIKIATIQELGVLPSHRATEAADTLIERAIEFSRANKAELLEQVVSSIDQWLIPTLINKSLNPSEIKADREISSVNEAKLILNNLRKNPKLNVIMNQLFYESNDDLESHIIEDEDVNFNEVPKKDPIAFGSVISIDKTEDLEDTLNELNKINVEWDEIGITFDRKL